MHLSSLIKASRDEWLVQMTSSINNTNPIVDRIMEDDSVEGVILTNEEGVPILTNINLNGATNYSLALKRLGQMIRNAIQEIDILDEVLTFRLITKKIEIMVAPHSEFNIIIIQHARQKNKSRTARKDKK